ncbi:DUF3794 domain-containing protein [Bacillus sp. NTK071]|uniref:DUF3794 domain-containing protein n=1 Tax=Bacillus sp. NTK071 TaxID=2802175 RepID=UPI001A8F13B6|nr:DUF3794 domain-containing protein [Bacillus sp. NTK071]
MSYFEQEDIMVSGLCDVDAFDLTGPGKYWTQLSVQETLILPEQKYDIEQLNSINIAVRIVRQKVIETPNSDGVPNQEGKLVTGRKLIVEGELCQTISYTADVDEQSVHSAQFAVPFSAFIVIGEDTPLTQNFQVNSCVEDVFVEDFTDRTIFKNVTLLLQAVEAPAVGCPEDQH